MRLNSLVATGGASPISEVRGWLKEHDPTRELLDVSQAVPGYPPPPELIGAVAEAMRHDDASRYGPVLGDQDLRSATAHDISRAYGAAVESDHVGITAGCNQAFCLAIGAVAGPGDEVIMPLPYYFNHDMWLRMQGIEPVYIEPASSFIPTADEIGAVATERTRAFVLVTPNNPTGAIATPRQLAEFAEVCRSAGIWLILDETYRGFRDVTEPPHALFGDPGWPEVLIHLYSFSKVYSITGYRVGALAAAPGVLAEVDKLADCLTICPSRPAQKAALFGLENLGSWAEGNRVMMGERLAHFKSSLGGHESGFKVASSGAYFAYLRHPFGERSRQVARRLLGEQDVLVLAGSMFGDGQDQYLRLAFGNLGFAQISELTTRLAAFAAG